MRILRIGLAIISVASIIAIFEPPPTVEGSRGILIHDKRSNFIWVLPEGWTQVAPMTGADYAFNFRTAKTESLVLDTWQENRDDANSLTKKLKTNPSLLFDQGVKPRFPVSRFLGSKFMTVNSRPAIQSECEFVTSIGNQVINWFCCQVVVIHNNIAYNFVLECPMIDRKRGQQLMETALEKIVFLEGGHFTYTGVYGTSFESEVPAEVTKEFLDEIAQNMEAYRTSFGQDLIPAAFNSLIQGMVFPFMKSIGAVLNSLESPNMARHFRQILVGTQINFPVNEIHQRRAVVRVVRYVPTVIYAGLLAQLLFRKKEVKTMEKSQNSEN